MKMMMMMVFFCFVLFLLGEKPRYFCRHEQYRGNERQGAWMRRNAI
jgi:hypothetical protein